MPTSTLGDEALIRTGLGQRTAGSLRNAIDSRWARLVADIAPQFLALAAAATIYAFGPPVDAQRDVWVWAVLAVAFAGLRLGTLRTALVTSTYVLDAVGVAIFIGGTGDAESPFLGIALAGAWWASQKAARGTLYAIAFAASYSILVAPAALREGHLAAVIFQPTLLCIVGLLADSLRARGDLSRWAFTILTHEGESQPASVRVGLSRVVRGGSVPIDVLLTAGQLGLTAAQTELVAYLILGLSNMQIAEALSLSEATVRYRLTRLYRVLGVRGRKAAAERARELGLGDLVGSGGGPAAV
ncbi:MAG TPA: LuxR C-terminal-related transcriptional regulator [Candidatus Limnocylindria bacterium]|nr:LuxR C-terminal-related transcriptional regulator [Candidatus Limnocylindria bacterium]